MNMNHVLTTLAVSVLSASPLFASDTPQPASPPIEIGWASTDLTPERPVQIAGQFHTRISEGVQDRLTATALVLANTTATRTSGVVMVSCDIVSCPDELLGAVREQARSLTPDLDPMTIVLNATHTHCAPELRGKRNCNLYSREITFDIPTPEDYITFASRRIAGAIASAWKNRHPGSIGYGTGQAVIGHNRRIANRDGSSRMYGNTSSTNFSHIEGFEEHTVNLMATWDARNRLAGLVVNVACPAQVSEQEFTLSADFWNETREELRRRFGRKLFILPQCSAAGDMAPRNMFNDLAERRMERLAGDLPLSMDEVASWKPPVTEEEKQYNERRSLALNHSRRKAIATRIANAVSSALPLMAGERMRNPILSHRVGTVELTRRILSEKDVQDALAEAAPSREKIAPLLREISAHPEIKQTPRWYVDITRCFRHVQWCEDVQKRFELEKTQPKLATEIHVVRVGDVAFASNPFELYLDFGIRIKARSPAIQTFLVQLAGNGNYVPSERAVTGKSYGAVPASTPVGPEGGQELVEWTVGTIKELWERK